VTSDYGPADALACELLAEARRRVASGWCQRTAARDASGRSVVPNDPAAASWSTTGAIIAAARTNRAATREAVAQAPFALAMSALSTVVGAGPQSWNDEPERSQNDVLAALAAAPKLLLGDEPPGR
jgi:hypothetical protein